jgi:hypothetical protein
MTSLNNARLGQACYREVAFSSEVHYHYGKVHYWHVKKYGSYLYCVLYSECPLWEVLLHVATQSIYIA